jgi:hypothetical protein
MMKKCVLFIATTIFLYSSVIKADTLEEGMAEHYRGNHARALELLHPIAEKGNVKAQGLLGQIYLRGEGVRDYQQALKWCRLAANQGDVNAQANLGLMYGRGKGVDPDYHEAVKWYRLAAGL